MADYADWTESIELLGSEVMVPFDVQSAYIQVPMDLQGALIQMPIDIQGQYITLDINIESVAADVTLNVNITASAVTINMDIKAQSVAVKSQGEWSPQAGQQKYFTATQLNVGFNTEAYAQYAVPTGKTLYITHLSFSANAAAVANADNHQHAKVYISIVGVGFLAYLGGNGGGGISFPTPLKVSAGETFNLSIIAFANHNLDCFACAAGYEL